MRQLETLTPAIANYLKELKVDRRLTCVARLRVRVGALVCANPII